MYPSLERALVGVASRCGMDPCVVYDYYIMVQCFIEEGMTEEEAVEWIDFNILGAYIGERTPLILVVGPIDEVE